MNANHLDTEDSFGVVEFADARMREIDALIKAVHAGADRLDAVTLATLTELQEAQVLAVRTAINVLWSRLRPYEYEPPEVVA